MQEHFSGNNWINNMGIDGQLYEALYGWSNIVASVASIGGNAFTKYSNVDIIGNKIGTIKGAKPFQRYRLIDDKGIKQYRFFDGKGNAWYDKDFYHGGAKHNFPHYNVWRGTARSRKDKSFKQLLQWIITGGKV